MCDSNNIGGDTGGHGGDTGGHGGDNNSWFHSIGSPAGGSMNIGTEIEPSKGGQKFFWIIIIIVFAIIFGQISSKKHKVKKEITNENSGTKIQKIDSK